MTCLKLHICWPVFVWCSWCLSALLGRLGRVGLFLVGLGWRKIKQRTYNSHTSPTQWLSIRRCNLSGAIRGGDEVHCREEATTQRRNQKGRGPKSFHHGQTTCYTWIFGLLTPHQVIPSAHLRIWRNMRVCRRNQHLYFAVVSWREVREKFPCQTLWCVTRWKGDQAW